jgi:hypothetical protein
MTKPKKETAMTPSVKIIKLTPEIAKTYLDTIDHRYQRQLSKKTVKKYSRDISHDNWVNAGEVIRISDDGLLIDGQHRCAAVVMAGKPLPGDVIVIGGMDKGVVDKIDRGKGRTMRDIGRMWNFSHQDVVSVANFSLRMLGIQSPSDSELYEHSKKHEREYTAALRLMTGHNHVMGISVLPVKLAMAEFIARSDKAENFIDRLISGVCQYKGDPALTLRNFCFARAKTINIKGNRILYGKAISAAKAEIAGKNLFLLKPQHWDRKRWE